MVFESSGRRTWLMKDVLQAESPALAVTEDARHSRGAIGRLVAVREAGIFGALVALCVALSLASPYFFTLRNVFNVLQGMSTIGIMAIGMTIVLIAGGLDLSVGSVLAVGAVLTARLMTYVGVNAWLAAVAGLGAGLAFGLVNGLLVTRARIIPFIATLGTLSVGRGLAFLLATGPAGVASNVPMRGGGGHRWHEPLGRRRERDRQPVWCRNHGRGPERIRPARHAAALADDDHRRRDPTCRRARSPPTVTLD